MFGTRYCIFINSQCLLLPFVKRRTPLGAGEALQPSPCPWGPQCPEHKKIQDSAESQLSGAVVYEARGPEFCMDKNKSSGRVGATTRLCLNMSPNACRLDLTRAHALGVTIFLST